MQMLQRIDNPRDVVQVLGGRIPVDTGLGVDDVHGGARRAEVDAGAPRLHVMFGVLAMQHEMSRRARNRILDQGARKDQPSL